MFRKYFQKPVILFSSFILFTFLVSVFDRQPIGADETKVGFAAINSIFTPGHHVFFEVLSGICGVIAILVCVFFAAVGLMQLISGKSLKKVDSRIIVLGAFYVLTIILYIVFNLIPVNYRPFTANGELEISYPSSHTMLAICVFMSAVKMLPMFRIPDRAKKITAYVLYALSALTVIFRFFSGLHWFTDIVGGIIVSCAMLSLFDGSLRYVRRLKKNKTAAGDTAGAEK